MTVFKQQKRDLLDTKRSAEKVKVEQKDLTDLNKYVKNVEEGPKKVEKGPIEMCFLNSGRGR